MYRALVPILLVSALLVGCGGAQSPSCDPPSSLVLTIEAARRLNPDPRGRSLPTVVRIYQVTEAGPVETASFHEMWRTPEEVLGEGLLGTDEVTIYPGRRIVRGFERNPDANYLVAMALYRNPAGVSWRTILELPPTPGEQACAAQAGGADEDEVPDPVVPHILVELDTYRVEGSMELHRVDEPGCVGADCLEGVVATAEEGASTAEDGTAVAGDAESAASAVP